MTRVIRPPLLRAWAGPAIVAVLVLAVNPQWSAVFIICPAYVIGYHNGDAGTAARLLDQPTRANDSTT